MTRSELIERLEKISNYCYNTEGGDCTDPYAYALFNVADFIDELIYEIKKEEE